SAYLSRLWFDCLVHDPRPLRYLAELVGWDRIMLGTDYPFDMGLDDPIEFVDRVGLSPAARDGVLSTNVAGFLRAL
ncbi:MAG: amidohydrolase, partial [Acidimicrobiia bacterium]|nr:amidohydrolase [Acidimicrobiia bacterium]